MFQASRFAWAVGPRLFVAAALESLASIGIARGEAQRAVQLLAVASELRVLMGTPVRPVDQGAVEQMLATTRSTLGSDVFASVCQEAQVQAAEHIINMLPSSLRLG